MFSFLYSVPNISCCSSMLISCTIRLDWKEIKNISFDFQRLDEENICTKHGCWYNKMVGQKPYEQVDFVNSARLGPAEANFECCKLQA